MGKLCLCNTVQCAGAGEGGAARARFYRRDRTGLLASPVPRVAHYRFDCRLPPEAGAVALWLIAGGLDPSRNEGARLRRKRQTERELAVSQLVRPVLDLVAMAGAEHVQSHCTKDLPIGFDGSHQGAMAT